ncbi:MAG: MFS transporter [Glaciimonas sp.]|nr:MFS transporter [Glaciimonas sp.]
MKPQLRADRRIDVLHVIDGQHIGPFQIKLIVLCALVAMLDGFDVQSIAFVAPVVAQAFGIKINAFGPVFAAGLVGMAAGALMLGPLADRFGRKFVIAASTLTFGLFSLLTAWADSSSSLMLARLLTGLGLGAAMPNIIALTAEYAPKRIRAMLVTVMFLGFPFGAVVGGLISSIIIPLWGWQSVFILGGVAPLVLGAILLLLLPESARFLVHRQAQPAAVAALLEKAAPGMNWAPGDTFFISEESLSGASVKHLFTGGRGLGTLLLWVPFFMNLLLLFFLYNWLPPVLLQAGLPISKAIIATVLFNLGGVLGGIAMAYLIDRLGPLVVLGIAYALGAVSVAAIGMVNTSVSSIMVAVFVAGIFVVGAQFGANALAASFYPTSIRSTGVSWALGIGRFGSILGPLVGGFLLSRNLPFADLFLIAAIPAGCASLALLAFHYATRSRKLDPGVQIPT